MRPDFLASDFKTTPYWWDASPLTVEADQSLPKSVDVLIVGAGYTGLSAALHIARGGRRVLVCEAQAIGWGCSTRNGGQVSTSVKPSFAALAKKHGEDIARGLIAEGQASLEWIGDFIAAEKIDCNYQMVGRFHAAHSPAAFKELTNSLGGLAKGLEVPARIISRGEQRSEIATDAYHGGVVFEKHSSLDPGKYHARLLDLATSAGAQTASNCRVEAIQRNNKSFAVKTVRGMIAAQQIVIATNGYSGPLSPWHRRRIIPIGSYIIATEALPEGTMERLLPKNRIVSDTRKVLHYYRASPDRRRMIFGGRVSLAETDPLVSAPLLRGEMIRVFPELASAKISHSWMGYVGYTFDELAHCGEVDGVHYAMGYCGSGVGMAGYLGMRTGQRVLGLSKGQTAFQATRFETRLFYYGRPWFLTPVVRYYRWRDRLSLKSAKKSARAGSAST